MKKQPYLVVGYLWMSTKESCAILVKYHNLKDPLFDIWVTFLIHQIETLWDCGSGQSASQSVCLWWVGNWRVEVQKSTLSQIGPFIALSKCYVNVNVMSTKMNLVNKCAAKQGTVESSMGASKNVTVVRNSTLCFFYFSLSWTMFEHVLNGDGSKTIHAPACISALCRKWVKGGVSTQVSRCRHSRDKYPWLPQSHSTQEWMPVVSSLNKDKSQMLRVYFPTPMLDIVHQVVIDFFSACCLMLDTEQNSRFFRAFLKESYWKENLWCWLKTLSALRYEQHL